MQGFTEILGLMAGALTTLAFLPQLIQTFKTRSAKDLSLGMFIAFCLGVALWLVYGLLTGALPVILANALTLVFALTILIFKLIYG
jgi:MtN3 and saliva related transmembrane protein